ncbi:phage tail protein [Rahnella sikkimica]|uniref:phage tail protein n=1 Tax=Rahnella sikkimica TaxID=1805933 RepID=UPI000CF3A7E8|nr:phage tail protein [Rahnella sikkimica]
MSKFKSVVTALGQARIASAIASGKDVNITQLAVGDGNGSATTPSTSQTALVHETYRLPLNSIKTDNKNANWIIAEAIIPASVGGFWMREMGLFSSEGELIAVSNMADSYKPTLEEGSGRTQTLRMVITVTDTDAVTLTIDDTLVIATEEYVNNLLAEHEASRRHPDGTLTAKGFVQLSSAVDSASEVLAATPKAVKTSYDLAKSANDNANGRVPVTRKINGKALNADLTLVAGDVGAYNITESDNRFVNVSGDTINSLVVSNELTLNGKGLVTKNGSYSVNANTNTTNGFRVQGNGGQFADTYFEETIGQFAALGIHVSSGGAEAYYAFRNGGSLHLNGPDVYLQLGPAVHYTDGNIYGSLWNGYLNNWLAANNTNLHNDAQNLANIAENNVRNWVYGSFVSDIRLAASAEFQERSNNERMGGGVMTSFKDAGSSNYWIRLRPLQKAVGGAWYTVGYA